MKTPSTHLRILRSISSAEPRVVSCRSRRCYASIPERTSPPALRAPPSASAPAFRREIDSQPGFKNRNKQDDDENFIPRPLSRPIGMPNPPQPGDNMGIDERSLAQRRDDFTNFDKHLEKRAKMTKQISKPYFRDWSNMRFSKGKVFKSNERLFRGDVSLWFPNFYGETLRKDEQPRDLLRGDGYKGLGRDTCDVMKGKVSVVSIVSSQWAEQQVETFCSKEQNPDLHEAMKENADVAQRVWINYEKNFLKWWLLQLFRSGLRESRTSQEQGRYFMVRRGVTDVMKEAIGMLNEKVGFVYLVDQDCRIRWAGSAEAEPWEQQSLVKGLRKLAQETRIPKEMRVDPRRQLEDAVADVTKTTSGAAASG